MLSDGYGGWNAYDEKTRVPLLIRKVNGRVAYRPVAVALSRYELFPVNRDEN